MSALEDLAAKYDQAYARAMQSTRDRLFRIASENKILTVKKSMKKPEMAHAIAAAIAGPMSYRPKAAAPSKRYVKPPGGPEVEYEDDDYHDYYEEEEDDEGLYDDSYW